MRFWTQDESNSDAQSQTQEHIILKRSVFYYWIFFSGFLIKNHRGFGNPNLCIYKKDTHAAPADPMWGEGMGGGIPQIPRGHNGLN